MVFFSDRRLVEVAKTSRLKEHRAHALKKLSARKAHAEIAEVAMFGNYGDTRHAAVEYFSKGERWDFANWLRRIALDSNFVETQEHAVNILGEFASRKRFGVVRLFSFFRRLLAKGDEELVEHVKWQLGRIGRHGPREARVHAIKLLAGDARALARVVERGEFSEARKTALETLLKMEDKRVVGEHLQRAVTRSKHVDTARAMLDWLVKNQDYVGQANAGMYSKIREIRLQAVDELKRSQHLKGLVRVAAGSNFRDAGLRALKAAAEIGGLQALNMIAKRPSTKIRSDDLEALKTALVFKARAEKPSTS